MIQINKMEDLTTDSKQKNELSVNKKGLWNFAATIFFVTSLVLSIFLRSDLYSLISSSACITTILFGFKKY